MTKILLLDTNISSSPIYNYLVNNGNEVFVAGGNPNDFLAKSAKNYINIDYSKIDLVRNLIESLSIEYIVPGCNDLSYKICSELKTEFQFHGLDTPDVTETINNKEKFRRFAKKINLPIPEVISKNKVNNIWPLIVKPVDAYSGRGVTIVRESEKDKLPTAIHNAEEFSRTGTCIIEEFVEGQLYSHSGFIINSKIMADFIVEEYSTANSFVVDTSRVVYDLPTEMLNRIRERILALIKELKLVDGLIHTQFIKKENSFWFIEVTRRCPGDLYSELIELSTGFPYSEAYLKPFINQSPNMSKSEFIPKNILRHTISLPFEGFFSSLQFKFPILIEKYFPLSLAGDIVKASPNGRIGLLFLQAKSKNELENILKETLKRELYTL